mgnify:CR=1 FL=1
MRLRLGILSIAVIAVGMLTGCNRVQPIYNVQDRPVQTSGQRLSLDDMEHRIITAAQDRKWIVDRLAPGKLRATLRWRDHAAVVLITFDQDDYSIMNDQSQNLKQEDGLIHRKYNSHVRALAQEIDRALNRI